MFLVYCLVWFALFQGKPQLTCTQGTSYTVKAGTSFMCECTITGAPQPAVAWLYNGKAIELEKVKIADTYTTLSLPRITAEQAGSYQVSAENTAGKDSITLTVSVVGEYSISSGGIVRSLLVLFIDVY